MPTSYGKPHEPRHRLIKQFFRRKVSKHRQYSAVRTLRSTKHRGRSLFIDCGAYDGFSAVKFVCANPWFECVSFEPNPLLMPYYDQVPTRLVPKAVWTSSGSKLFYVDWIDADGSSLLEDKIIIYGDPASNSRSPSITVPTIHLADFVLNAAAAYDHIVLKLDVEGAEYELLADLISTGAIGSISTIFAEFHWEKCGVSEIEHKSLMSSLTQLVDLQPWDASDFAIFHRADGRFLRSEILKHYGIEARSYQTNSRLESVLRQLTQNRD